MTGATPILWVPASALRNVEATVLAALQDWARAWGLGTPAAATACAVPRRNAKGQDLQALGGCLRGSVPACAAWRSALAQGFFKMPASGSAIVDGVIKQATADLRGFFIQRFGAADEGEPELAQDLPGDWGVELRVDLLGCPWHLRLPCSALSAHGWLAAPKPQPLPRWQPDQACAHLPLQLQAVVGTAQVNVTDLLHLAEGDVILLSEELDAPIHVRSLGTALRLPAQLGATANADPNQRALRWLATDGAKVSAQSGVNTRPAH